MQPITQLCFNDQPCQHNLVATVGHDQATVYDDQHMGSYLAVVCHFVNGPTRHHAGGVRDANSGCLVAIC